MHQEQLQLISSRTGNVKAFTKASIPPKHLQQSALQDTVKSLLQVQKAHMDCLSRLTELVPELNPLNPRFNYLLNSPFQYSRIDFLREAEEGDPIIGTDPPVPLFGQSDQPPLSAGPEALFPTALRCCTGVSAKTAL